ncbi:MAG TPA: signal peptidase II [Chloroflexia bacterium]|nr:signal peptidase II [Chloroflexia bacterium]
MKQTNPKSKIQNPKSKIAILLVAAILALALDQLTKLWVVANVAEKPAISIISGFARLRYTENTGAAFGFFKGWSALLSVAAILIVVAIVISASKVSTNPLSMVALGLVVGGALGNMVDRLRLGYVVDFIDVYGPRISINNVNYTFPVFNVADSAITVGAILLMATLIFGKESPQTAQAMGSSMQGETSDTHISLTQPASLTPKAATPAGWAGLAVMLAGLFLIAFRQASRRS